MDVVEGESWYLSLARRVKEEVYPKSTLLVVI